jgi:hypothetical protein
VAMATDEMHFLTPWRKDFVYYAKRAGNIKNNQNLSNFLKNIFAGKPHGAFWKKLNQTKIDKSEVYERIFQSKRTLRDILTIILEEYALSEGKKRFGAKYPVHFSKSDILFDWWPDCKVIHLVRDPRAICASKVNDDATRLRKKKYRFFGPLIHFGTQLFFVIEYIWSCRFYVKYKGKKNYYKVRFEDLVTNPTYYLKELCNFCELEYDPSMMYPFGKPSSYDQRLRWGFDKTAAFRWKKTQTDFETKWITFLTRSSMKKLGYKNISQEYIKWMNHK